MRRCCTPRTGALAPVFFGRLFLRRALPRPGTVHHFRAGGAPVPPQRRALPPVGELAWSLHLSLQQTGIRRPAVAGTISMSAMARFYDEMFGRDEAALKHYRKLQTAFAQITPEDYQKKRNAVDLAFLRQGVTFNVYGD